ncbi:MAG: undecaprenyldiphospho-muramoylpentapeptide beta-N-acetylglucosaminyltransferase [Deltaproteobacteria bacterium]|nr:undecaprenyldiphospho-muramoylpentapeptide beta-N-acetylglucosaminyltransferase [Deltaproteobacteria bacterium]
MRLLIAGGGTGGHLYPGIAIARALAARGSENAALFVGTARGLEKRLVPQAGFPLRLIRAGALKGMGPWRAASTLLGLPGAIVASSRILREWRPDAVLGVGGYASGPVMVAAALLGAPRAVLEPNAIPGITNRILGRIVREIYVAWEETAARFPVGKAIVTGNPVRDEVTAVPDPTADGPFSLLVFGGSQGARRINETMMAALDELGDEGREWRFVHQTGPADAEKVRAAYATRGLRAETAAFYDDMPARYRNADLVLCRAGAATIAELCGAGRGAILVPYPFAADDHQTANARLLERAGAACVIPQEGLTPGALARTLRELARPRDRAREMGRRARALARPDAAVVILDRLERLAAAQ